MDDGDPYLDYSQMLGDVIMEDGDYPIDPEMFMNEEGYMDPEMMDDYYGDDMDMYQYYQDMQDYIRAEEEQHVFVRQVSRSVHTYRNLARYF